jgi:hypothetical protein
MEAAGAEPVRANPDAPVVSLHSLPCTIRHSGAAPVSNYFIVKTEPQLRSAFRGRELFGVEVHVPENHHGLVVRETAGQWAVAGRFSSYIHWQRTPTAPNAPPWMHAFTVLPAVRSLSLSLSLSPPRGQRGHFCASLGRERLVAVWHPHY